MLVPAALVFDLVQEGPVLLTDESQKDAPVVCSGLCVIAFKIPRRNTN